MMDQPSQQTKRFSVRIKRDKRFEAEIERAGLRYSIFDIILAILMIAIGAKFYGTVDGKEICPNNAAWWLLTAGLVFLGLNLINVIARIYRGCVLDQGKNSFVERCGMEILLISSAAMTIVDFVVIIWGAILVFGSYSSWTDNLGKYERNMEKPSPEELNYCPYTPMMTAFVILIVKFILIPALIIMVTVCACCVSCLSISRAPQESAQVIEIGEKEEETGTTN